MLSTDVLRVNSSARWHELRTALIATCREVAGIDLLGSVTPTANTSSSAAMPPVCSGSVATVATYEHGRMSLQ